MVAVVSGNGGGLINGSAGTLGSQGMFGNAALGATGENAFVNIANGNLMLQTQDDFLAAHGLDLAMTRTYNSQGNLNDGASAQWKLGLLKQVANLTGTLNSAGSTVTRLDGDGSTSLFTWDAARGAYISTDGAGGYQSIVMNPSQQWVWRADHYDVAGLYETYDSTQNGRIVNAGDEVDVRLRYSYNSAGRVDQILDASGELTRFEYDSHGNLTNYSLQLADSSEPYVHVTYGYDSQQRLSSASVDINKEVSVGEVFDWGNNYDGQIYRVATDYTYEGTSNRIASVSQVNGPSISVTYLNIGGEYRVKTITDALGAVTSFDYSVANQTSVTDARGFKTDYAYDGAGRLTVVTAPAIAGASQVTRFAYDDNGNVTSMIDRAGAKTVYGYDANGNRTLESDSAGLTITRTFDPVGNKLLTETRYALADPMGTAPLSVRKPLTTRYVYDGAHRLRFQISAQGRVTEYRYNVQGERASLIQYEANFYSVAGMAATFAPAEDTLANWVATTDRTQTSRVDYLYDGRGLMASATSYSSIDSAGNGVAATQSTVTYAYDQAGRVLHTVDGRGYSDWYIYDMYGRPMATKDRGMCVSYHCSGRTPLAGISAMGGPVSAWLDSDDLGFNQYTELDAAGRTYRQTTFPDGAPVLTTYAYDANGNVRMSDGPSGKHFWFYDAQNRKVAEVDETGAVSEFIYDAKGQLARTKHYAKVMVASALVNADGSPRDVDIASLRNNGTGAGPEDRDTYYNYDAAGRLTTVMNGDFHVTSYAYDGASRLVKVFQRANPGTPSGSDPFAAATVNVTNSTLDRVTRSFFDNDGVLIGTLDADGYLKEYIYNAGGQLVDTIAYAGAAASAALRSLGTLADLKRSVASASASDVHERRLYDGKNQVIAIIDGEQYLTELGYDAAGNVSSRKRYATPVTNPGAATFAGLGAASGPGDQLTTYTYTARGQLDTELGPDGSFTQYTYDWRGKVVTNIVRKASVDATDARESAYRYQNNGQLIAELDAEAAARAASANPAEVERIWEQESIRYTYDRAGNRASMTDQDGHRTLYFYDGDGRQTHTVNAEGEVAEVVYNAFGQVAQKTMYANRMSTGALAALSGGPMSAAFANGLAGLRAAMGYDRVQSFTYDNTGKLVRQFDGTEGGGDALRGGDTTVFDYNAFGELGVRQVQNTGHTGYITEATYSYDNRGHLVETRPFGNAGMADITTFDAFGRASRHDAANGTGETTNYDRLGRVVSTQIKGASGLSEVISYDAFNRILTQTDALGTGVTRYTYDTAAHTMSITSPEGVTHTTTRNRYGETVSIDDGKGNVTTYTYNRNGALADVKDARGVIVHNEYDNAGLLYTTTDANGTVTTFSYDKANRVLSKKLDSARLNLTTTYEYDAIGRVATVTDPRGVQTVTRFDKKGQVRSVGVGKLNDPTPYRTTEYTYDSRGNQLTVTDPSLRTVTFTFSEAGFEHTRTDGANEQLLERYDNSGRNLLLRAAGADHSEVTRYAYNNANQLAYEIAPDGTVTGYTYDADLRLVGTTRYAVPSTLIDSSTPWSATFSADQIRLSLHADAARDATSVTVYDRDGRVYGSVDATGTVTVNLAFDNAGRVTEQRTYAKALGAALPAVPTLADLNAAIGTAVLADAVADRHQRFVYDAHGNLTATLSADGIDAASGLQQWSVQSQQFDANGNLVSRTGFAKPMKIANPSAADIAQWTGNIVNTDPSDSALRLVYDAANRLVSTATLLRATGSAQEWSLMKQEYDASGNVTLRRVYTKPFANPAPSASEIAAGSSVNDAQTRYLYNAQGQATATAVAQGADSSGALVWALTTHSYDASGNEIERDEFAQPISLPDATGDAATAMGTLRIPAGPDRQTRYAYDSANRLTATVDAAGSVSLRSYDATGNVVAVTAYATPYTADGALDLNLIVKDAAHDRISRTVYDAMHRPAMAIDATGAVTERVFDGLGNTTKTIRYAKALSAAELAALPATPTQDQIRQYTGTDARIERSVADTEGRVLFSIDALGYFTQYDYDALGRLKASYAYQTPVSVDDANLASGLKTAAAAQAATARVTRYNYDGQGNVLDTTDALQGKESYTYDAQGRKLTFTNKANATWTYHYGATDRVMTEVSPQVAIDGGTASLGADHKWQFALTATLLSSITTQFDYDALGNLTARTEAAGQANARTVSYQYDAAGHQTRIIYPDTWVYDTAESATSNGATGDATAAEKRVTLTVETGYNAFGEAISNKDVGGKMSYKAYDQGGRVVYELDAERYVTGYSRNAFGETETLTRYADRVTVTAAVATSAMYLPGSLNKSSPNNREVKTEYDKAGRAVKVTEPAVYIDDQDASGASVYTTAAKTTAYAYNAYGQVIRQSVYGASGAASVTQVRDSYYYYDRQGQLRTQAEVVERNGSSTQSYLTTMEYEADGQLHARKEFATALTLSDQQLASGSFTPTSDANDRETVYHYDKLGRKDSESRIGVRYVDSSGADRAGTLVTGYGYDALGNLTATTDALGNTSRNWYDVLGRLSATATTYASAQTQGGATAPLTVYRRDVFGNVVQRIDYAAGFDARNLSAPAPVATDALHDRITSNVFDSTGQRVVQSIDAEQNATFTSYDAYGNVAKVWQRVSAADGSARTAFQVNSYDALGRLTAVATPDVRNAVDLSTTVALSKVYSDYNAFGELTGKRISDSGNTDVRFWYADYDNAGHVWRTNDGDGIDKVTLYDILGNATAQIRSSALRTSDTASALTAASITKAADALQLTDVVRTNTRYDLLGRVVDVRQQVVDKLYTLQRDAAGFWNRVAYAAGGNGSDAAIVVGGPGDEGQTITVQHRLVGSDNWVDASATRVSRVGDYLVFNTAGLAQGDYEFKVFAQWPNTAPAERQSGVLTTTSTQSTARSEQIARIYGLLLGRAADSAGLNYYTKLANDGVSYARIIEFMLASGEGLAQFPADTSGSSVMTSLFARLGKPADAAELATWSAAYERTSETAGDNHGLTIAALMDAMLSAPATSQAIALVNRAQAITSYLIQYRGNNKTAAKVIWDGAADLSAGMASAASIGRDEFNRNAVTQLYIALFGRAPDASGLQFWFNATANLTLEAVAGGMLDSGEGRSASLFPTTDPNGVPLTSAQFNSQLVNGIYLNMLGRAASASELADWTAQLDAGTAAKRGDIVLRMIAAVADYTGTDAARRTDKTTFNYKVALGAAYALLGRDDDIAVLRALTSVVGSADDAKAAADQAVLTLQARSNAANATASGAALAAGAMPLEEMRLQMSRLYVALLARAPDNLGMAFYVNSGSAAAGDWAGIATALITSSEGRNNPDINLPGLTADSDFVKRIYSLALGKLPATLSASLQAEIDGFVAQIAAGKSRAQVAVGIANGLLGFANLTAEEAALKATYLNKVGVGIAYALGLQMDDEIIARATTKLVTDSDITAALDYAYGKAQLDMTTIAAIVASAGQARTSALTSTQAASDAVAAATATATAIAGSAGMPTAAPRVQIAQLYAAILGRNAGNPIDLPGLNFFTDNLPTTSLTIAARGMFNSPEGLTLFPVGMAEKDVVAKLYSTILGSNSVVLSAGRSEAWVTQLKAAPTAREVVAVGILNEILAYTNTAPDAGAREMLAAKAEFAKRVYAALAPVDAMARDALVALAGSSSASIADLTAAANLKSQSASTARTAATNALNGTASAGDGSALKRLAITRLYATLLKRTAAPTLAEVDFYVNTPIEQVAQYMIDSEEGKRIFPADNAAFINVLYQCVLGRAPEATEYLGGWIGRLAAGTSRGTVAVDMLNAMLNYSDGKSSQVLTKTVFDDKIAGFLATEQSQAMWATFDDQSEINRQQGLTASAYSDWQQGVAWRTETERRIAESTAAAVDAESFISLSGYQSDITRSYIMLRGNTDFSGVVWWMHVYADPNQPNPHLALIDGLLSAGGFSSDPTQFVVEMYQQVLHRSVSSSDEGVQWWVRNAFGGGQTRAQVADGIMGSGEANDKNSAATSAAMSADMQTANGLISTRNMYINVYPSFQENERVTYQAYLDATAAEASARAKLEATNNKVSALGALISAYPKVKTADTAVYEAAKALEAVSASNAYTSIKASILLSQANVSSATAAVSVADAFIADLGMPAAARQAKQVTQLMLMLLNRPPKVADMRSWTAKLAAGKTREQIAAEMMSGSEATMKQLYPAGQSDAAFVTQLYSFAVNRGFANDPDGLRFWTDKLTVAPVSTRAELVGLLIDGFSRASNPDTVLFNNKLATALQAVATEASTLTPTSYLSGAIDLAISDALGAARQYDAAAVALAAQQPRAQFATQLAQLYVTLFNRAPDADGLNFWANAMSNGTPLVTVADGLITSAEGNALFAGKSTAEFVTLLFTKAMGRTPTAAELTAYSGSGRAQLTLDIIRDVAGAIDGSLVHQATRAEFQGKVIAALAKVIPSTQAYAQTLSTATLKARDVAALNPVDQHADPIAASVMSVMTAGTIATRAPTTNLLTLDRWGNTLTTADVRNPNWITEYRYDASNHVTMVMKPLSDDSFKGTKARAVSEYGYDVNGRLAKTVDGNGNQTRYVYDGNGNLVNEIHADGGVVVNAYDVFGNRTAVTKGQNAAGQGTAIVTNYAYDRLGQLSTITYAKVHVYTARDVAGDMGTQDDGELVLSDRFEYDEAGHRIASWNGANEKTTMRYDLAGNVIAVLNAKGLGSKYGFDSFHNKIMERDANGLEMTWMVDSFGRVKQHTDLGKAQINYTYNELNQVVTQTSAFTAATSDARRALGQQNVVNTYENGMLTKVQDAATNSTTTYAYDLAGNRVLERMVSQNAIAQNNHIAYDELGRMKKVRDDHFNVDFSYDRNGNRTLVKTVYLDLKGPLSNVVANYNRYDSMNRADIVNGELVGNVITAGQRAHVINYDYAGNRKTDSYQYELGTTTETYQYDLAGRLTEVWRDGYQIEHRYYDRAGRLTEQGAVYSPLSTYRDQLKRFGIADAYRTYAYDTTGQVVRMKMRDTQTHFLDDMYYSADALFRAPTSIKGYDLAGNSLEYSVYAGDARTRSTYASNYVALDSYKETSVLGTNSAGSRTTTTVYDANGNIASVSESGSTTGTRNYVTDQAGRVLLKTQDGVTTHTLIVNGEVLGTDPSYGNTNGMANIYESGYTGVNLATATVYNVQSDSETLQGIAKSVWGDSNLWYLIADANGLSATPTLTKGMVLKIPSRINTISGEYSTFKPYNAAEAIGSTTPTLPTPAADKGCGTIGTIIMVVVAVVVTIYTAGALTGATVNVFAAGMSALAGTSATALGVVGGALAGAAGSVASQLVGNAIGAQDGFSWKSVALAAIGGGIAAGLNEVGALAGKGWDMVAARAALGNVASQGIGIATGLQKNFQWRNVAAATVGAVVGNSLAPGQDVTGIAKLAGSTLSGIAAGVASAVVRGGRIEFKQIAADAFGNALGNSIAENMKESEANRQFIKALDKTKTPYTLDENGRAIADPNFRASYNFVQGAAQGGATVEEIAQAKAALAGGLSRLDSAPGDFSEETLRNRTVNALAAQGGTVEGRSLSLLSSDLAEGHASSSYLEHINGSLAGPKGASIIGNTFAGGITLMTEFAGFYAEHEFAATAAYKGVQAVLSGGPVKTVVLEVAKLGMESVLRDATGAVANVAETQARGYVTDYAKRKGWEFDFTILGQNVTVGPEQFGQAAGTLAGGVVESILGTGVDTFANRGLSIAHIVKPGQSGRLDALDSQILAKRNNGRSPYSEINGAIGEAHGLKHALDAGHVSISRPGKASVQGPDFITYDPSKKSVVIWDSKYRGPNGTYPSSLPQEKLAKWQSEIVEAVRTMPEGAAKTDALRALQAGRVTGQIFKWPK